MADPLHMAGHSGLFSQHDADLARCFSTAMRESILWPHNLPTRSLEVTLAELREVWEELLKTHAVTSSYCFACKTGMREHLTQIIDAAETPIKGVCLDCFQGKDDSERKCRIHHEVKVVKTRVNAWQLNREIESMLAGLPEFKSRFPK